MENVVGNILKKNTENVNKEDVKIVPTNINVILEFYEDNPYRSIVEDTTSGLILGIESTKRYKSQDTGEIEDTQEYIACAKVIAVGDACRYTTVGDDVFVVKYLANPIPFRNKGYYVVAENNIICSLKPND